MAEAIQIVVITVSGLLQLGAAYCSYVIYRYNRLKKGWLSITGALMLMTASSVFGLLIQEGSIATNSSIIALYTVWIPVLISLFLFTGIQSMMKSFESFDLVEKQVGGKAEEFFKKANAGKKAKKK